MSTLLEDDKSLQGWELFSQPLGADLVPEPVKAVLTNSPPHVLSHLQFLACQWCSSVARRPFKRKPLLVSPRGQAQIAATVRFAVGRGWGRDASAREVLGIDLSDPPDPQTAWEVISSQQRAKFEGDDGRCSSSLLHIASSAAGAALCVISYTRRVSLDVGLSELPHIRDVLVLAAWYRECEALPFNADHSQS